MIGMKKRYYLAYGSNLNIRQMQIRCPDAKPAGSVLLDGYELLFRGCNGSAVATIEPKDGGSVPCALWLITPKDEIALDRYEGFPHFYRKEMVLIQFGRRRMKVMVYVMNDGHALAMPGGGYLGTILDGYRDFRLDQSALNTALRVSASTATSEDL